MKQASGIWLPDGDTHFPPMLENAAKFWKRPTYQVDKLLACLPYIKRFGHVVDIGAHCGLWSMVMVRCFQKLTAFEPIPAHVACWQKNVVGGNAAVHQMAVGNGVTDTVRMKRVVDNSGLTHVNGSGDIEVKIVALDTMGLSAIDFIKCDCEGHEYFALQGTMNTLQRDKPCVLVEQVELHAEQSAVSLLRSIGAKHRFTYGRDHCLSWD